MSDYSPELEQVINYTPFNKVSDITEGNKSLSFTYGSDYQRRKTEFNDGAGNIKTKYFAGSFEEETDNQGNWRKLYYIPGADGLAAVMIVDNSGTNFYYTYSDHLGSILAVTRNDEQTIFQEQSFDAWGNRREPSNWSSDIVTTFNILDRGYTGHEHLYAFGLVNMNGRLYDPALGRMLSPDPYVQMPDYSQNYNRYSYVLNNPLKYTDPDGNNAYLIAGGLGFLTGYVGYGLTNNDWGMNAVKQGGMTSLQFMLGYGMAKLPSNGGYGYAPTNVGALAYSGNAMLNTAINQFVPPISFGGMSFSISISPRGFAINQTISGNVNGFDLAYGINSIGDRYYGASLSGRKGNFRLSWYRTDFAGDWPQGVAGIGISEKNWSFRVDEDLGAMGGDGYDRFRSGGFQAEWGNFVLGGRVITNDNTANQDETIQNYRNPVSGKTTTPINKVYGNGQVWSSPFMVGYKTKYGIMAFEHNNPIYQHFLQNGVHYMQGAVKRLLGTGNGTPFFQSQPYNSFSIKSYRQNPFSIYFY